MSQWNRIMRSALFCTLLLSLGLSACQRAPRPGLRRPAYLSGSKLPLDLEAPVLSLEELQRAMAAAALLGGAPAFEWAPGLIPMDPDWLRRTQGGTIGGNGNDFFFFDPETGASYMPGSGVSW